MQTAPGPRYPALEADCWCGAVLADEAALAVDGGNIAAVTAIVLIIHRLPAPWVAEVPPDWPRRAPPQLVASV